MDSSQSAFESFHPEEALQQIPKLLPGCKGIEQEDHGRTLIVHLSGETLGLREFGRLTIINGKCRNQGMKLILHCPHSMAHQMTHYSLDRLIWIQQENTSAC